LSMRYPLSSVSLNWESFSLNSNIKESAEKSGRYGKRAKEVAVRTVMKQHKSKGHKKGE
jgi:hypothetical protein